MVPPASHKIPRASWYSGSRPLCSAFRLRGFYPLSLTFPGNSTRPDFDSAGPQPRKAGASRFGLCPLRSPLLWASKLNINQRMCVDLKSTRYLTISCLHRKEVIQPHLPIRLPCYDFTPIIGPTLDGWLLIGYLTGFGCYQLSWCDGRCVQGPGTYSPQYADLRLLAIPTSRRRVAACDPN